ncbi:MAG: dienelactone hydrolase family protein, partial [Nitrospira sp.]|nr:dienelactone hydrolase family protein [Nitrospira sp.]
MSHINPDEKSKNFRISKIFLGMLVVMITGPFSVPAFAGNDVVYNDGETKLQGYWSNSLCSEKPEVSPPLVLIVHQWKGLGAYETLRADMLASECYNVFAIDMYGQGIRPKSTEEAGQQASMYKNDPDLARKRLKAALDFALTQDQVNPDKVAIIGYCFGGTMALELARSGAPIRAAISFHGGLATKAPAQAETIKASIQIHHGADDPHVPPQEVQAFMEEMNSANADWSITTYAHAVHSFTEKAAGDDPSKGVAYNEQADHRS